MGNKSHFFRQSSGGGGDAFIATFRTTTVNESITLPYVGNGTYSGTIDWGDGTITENTYDNRTHTYLVSGDYDVTVLGECVGFGFFNSGDKDKIINLKNWGNGFRFINNTNGYFRGCTNLDITATDTPTLDNINTFVLAFRGCPNLIWNETINDWDVSSIIKFDYMFDSGTNQFSQSLNGWTFSQPNTSLQNMFASNTGFNGDIGDWDLTNVKNIQKLFNGASSFNQNINNWDVTGLTSLNSVFSGASSFNQPLNNWDVSNISNIGGIFLGASSFNQDINNWDISKVTSLSNVFSGTSSFNKPLNNWNTSKVTDFNSIFSGANSFNQDISSWDFSAVTRTNSLNILMQSNYNPIYYDNLLIKWAKDTSEGGLPLGIIANINMRNVKYTPNGAAARQSILDNNKAVTITDGGQI